MPSIERILNDIQKDIETLPKNGSCGFYFSAEGAKEMRVTQGLGPLVLPAGVIGLLIGSDISNHERNAILRVRSYLTLVVSLEDDLFIKYVEKD